MANIVVAEAIGNYYNTTQARNHFSDKFMMEKIDNYQFLDCILSDNFYGLQKEDILHIDNATIVELYASNITSAKIILAKNFVYLFSANYDDINKLNCDTINETKKLFRLANRHNIRDFETPLHRKRDYYSTPYVTQDEIVGVDISDIDTDKLCKKFAPDYQCGRLNFFFEKRGDVSFAWLGGSKKRVMYKILHHYNDIYKIKEIVDERVAYWLAKENENNETK
ncbi:hypothetical protein AGMMS50229_04440 [Campylobacterota bacterium]|nr:hypothetical protein AGMMS50229_04440 [Campylobacterota bacterium]